MNYAATVRSAALIASLTLIAGCSASDTKVVSTLGTTSVSGVTAAGNSTSSPATSAGPTSSPSAASPAASTEKREFLFQIDRYTTANQDGQTMNMYFRYRYNASIADTDIPNYIDLRTKAIAFMDAVDTSQNPYWETLNQQLCGELHDSFPIEAISCQLQVYPDDRTGAPYEPGFHSSIDTIGDIEPLAIVGPVTTG